MCKTRPMSPILSCMAPVDESRQFFIETRLHGEQVAVVRAVGEIDLYRRLGSMRPWSTSKASAL